MKKLKSFYYFLFTLLYSFYFATATKAISITQPPNTGVRAEGEIGPIISSIFNNIITIIFTIAALAVLFMLIWGAFEWITSGGDKEAVAKARKRITTALIGLVILSLAFLIVNVIGEIVNIDIFREEGWRIPTLGNTE